MNKEKRIIRFFVLFGGILDLESKEFTVLISYLLLADLGDSFFTLCKTIKMIQH